MATPLGIHAPNHPWIPAEGAFPASELAAALGNTGPYLWLGGTHVPKNALDQSALDASAIHFLRLPTPLVDEPAGTYAARVDPIVTDWRGAGVPHLFVVPGNEPEIVTRDGNGQPSGDVPVAWLIPAWMTAAPEYAAALTTRFGGIRLASPPFSVEKTSTMTAAFVVPYAAVTCHVYWEGNLPSSPNDALVNPGLGQAWTHAADVAAGKPVFITEMNVVHTDAAISASGNLSRPEQIINWLIQLDNRVHGVAFFIADSAVGYPDHILTPDQGKQIFSGINPPQFAPVPPARVPIRPTGRIRTGP